MLAALPLFPAPIEILAIGEVVGTTLYALALVGLFVGLIVTQMRENAQRDVEQGERDLLAKQRYEQQRLDNQTSAADIKAAVAQQVAQLVSAYEARYALQARGVPASDPQMQQIAETVRVSTATIGGILSLPSDGPFQLPQGMPPITVMPSVSSKDKPKG